MKSICMGECRWPNLSHGTGIPKGQWSVSYEPLRTRWIGGLDDLGWETISYLVLSSARIDYKAQIVECLC